MQFFKISCALVLVTNLSLQLANAESIAFIGDEFTTGYRDYVEGDAKAVSGSAPTEIHRLVPSVREFSSIANPMFGFLINAYTAAKFDNLNDSWFVDAAKALGYKNALIAAEDFARVDQGVYQVDRVLRFTQSKIPEKVFIFYSRNDLCANNMFNVTDAASFAASIRRTIRYLVRNSAVGEKGSDIYIVSHLPVMQLVSSPEILAKPLSSATDDAVKTCGDLKKSGRKSAPAEFKFGDFNADSHTMIESYLAPVVRGLHSCDIIYGKNSDASADQHSALANRIRKYREDTLAMITRESALLANTGIRLHMIRETESLLFSANEISEDCFHLSPLGQRKLAATILEGVAKK